MAKRVWRILARWIPLAIAIAGLGGLTYLTGQQIGRNNANDPQVQIAEDAAIALAQGAEIDSVLPVSQVDAGRSLAPFVIVYDDAGMVLASTGLLHGEIPTLPDGVLDYTRQHEENRITWQPESSVRIAAVIVRYEGDSPGFVLAGRSLREVESRDTQMLTLSVLATGLTLAATLALTAFFALFSSTDPSG